MEYSRRAARHGRGVRGPILPPEVPRWKSRSADFDQTVLDAYAPLYEQYADELNNLDIAVDMVPRMRSHDRTRAWPDDVYADGYIPLGRLVPAGVDDAGVPTRPRIVIFRQPIEMRAPRMEDRLQLIRRIHTHLIASYLNLSPQDIDPDY